MKITIALVACFLFASFLSCEKTEGPGGTATVAGKIWVQNYDGNFIQILNEYWAEEEDVYLIYGTDSIYSDRTKTNYDGSYWFQYLNPGTYTIFVYSDDNTKGAEQSPSGRVVVKHTFTIGKKDSEYIVPTLTILD